MKFSGIISSLAIASAVSAAALPFAPIGDATPPKVGSTLSGVEDAVKGAANMVTGSGVSGLDTSVPATRKRDAVGEAKSLLPGKVTNVAGGVSNVADGLNLPTGNLPTSNLPTSNLPTGNLPANNLPAGNLPTGGVSTRDLPATPKVPDVTQNLPNTGTVTDKLPTNGADDVTHSTNLALLAPVFQQLVEDSQKESWDDFAKHFHVLLLYIKIDDLLELLAAIPALKGHY